MLQLKDGKSDSQARLINNIIRSPHGNYSFFLGAGCSISSGVPTALQIIDILRKLTFIDYQTLLNPLVQSPDESFYKFTDRLEFHILKYEIEFKDFVEVIENGFSKKINHYNELKDYLGESSLTSYQKDIEKHYFLDSLYGMWFEKYSESPRRRQELIEEIIKDIEPNGAYIFFAQLIKMGFIKNIFTTNFDDLINDALINYFNIKARVFSHSEVVRYIRFDNNRPNIIKLHGDFLYENIKNVNVETNSLDNSMQQKFSEALKNRNIVFLGYNGADQSIMKVLSSINKEERLTIYWCGLDETTLHWRVIKLLNESVNAYFIKIRNFDDFVFELLYNPPKEVEINLVQQAMLKEEKMKNYLDSFYKKRFKRSHKIFAETAELLQESEEWKDILEKIKDPHIELDALIKCYKVLYEFNPNISWIVVNYGAFLIQNDNHTDALNIFKNGIKKFPENAKIWFNLGVIYHDTDRLSDAREAFINSTKYDSQLNIAFHNLAATYNKLREYDKALLNIDTAIGLKQTGKSFVIKGIILKNLNKLEEAVKYYDKAVLMNDDTVEALLNRANALRLLKRYDEAEIDCFEALKHNKDHEYIYITFSQIYAEIGEVEKFYLYLLEALKRNYPLWRHLDDRAFRIFKDQPRFKKLVKDYCPINFYL